MMDSLARLPFWGDLTEQERDIVQKSAFLRRYEKGAQVHSSGQECLGLLLVLSGEIRTYLLSDEGREITLFRLYPGDLCVLSASCVLSQISFDTQLTAQQDTQVLVIPANVVARIKDTNLAARCYLYELATQRFSNVMWAMQQLLFQQLDQRLAAFLLAEYRRTGSPTVAMTHEQLAQQISSAREAVARILKQFAEDGLVELKRGAITILNPAGLEKLQQKPLRR